MKFITHFKNHITTSLVIKLFLGLFLILIVLLLYLESQEPNSVEISQISTLNLYTPLLVENVSLQIVYSSATFSILQLRSKNNSIIGTINQNISFLNESLRYSIIGKVSSYKGEKQIEIYSISHIS